MRAHPGVLLRRGRGRLARVTAATVILAFSTACATRTWKSVPVAPVLTERRILQGERVRIPVTGGSLILRVVRLDYPLLEGVPEAGPGKVTFPIGGATAEVRTRVSKNSLSLTPLRDATDLVAENLVDRDVQFLKPDGGRLALHVQAVNGESVRGEPIACWGDGGARCTATILVDLRTAAWLDVQGTDWFLAWANLALVGLVAFFYWLVDNGSEFF